MSTILFHLIATTSIAVVVSASKPSSPKKAQGSVFAGSSEQPYLVEQPQPQQQRQDPDGGWPEAPVVNVMHEPSVLHRLKRDLLTPYDRTIRPAKNVSQPTEMFVSMGILAVLNVDETEMKMRAFMSTELHWTDEYLRWTPPDYDGVELLTLPLHMVWSPDLMCDQTIEVKRPIAADRELIRVQHTGEVTHLTLEVHEFACGMHSADFPFDNQTCTLTYGSYGYDITQLRWGANAQTYHIRNAHPEWMITGFSAAHDEGEFSQMQLTLSIQRRPAFYVITLMYPSSLITFLSILGMFTPGEASLTRVEKINVAMSTLLTLSVLLIVVADIIPKSQSKYPQIGIFFFAQIGSIVGHTVIAIAIMYINTLPQWGVRYPNWLLGCTQHKPGSTKRSASADPLDTELTNPDPILNQLRVESVSATNNHQCSQPLLDAKARRDQQPLLVVLEDLAAQVALSRQLMQRTDDDDNQTNWNRLCFVLDAVALIVFLALQTALTVTYCSHDGQMIFG